MKNSVPIKAVLWVSVCNELLDAIPCHIEFVIARFDCSACTTGNTEIQLMQKCLFVFKKKDRDSFYNVVCNLSSVVRLLSSGDNK